MKFLQTRVTFRPRADGENRTVFSQQGLGKALPSKYLTVGANGAGRRNLVPWSILALNKPFHSHNHYASQTSSVPYISKDENATKTITDSTLMEKNASTYSSWEKRFYYMQISQK